VTAEASGDGAYVALQSVEAFPPGGGEATFELGSPNEEVFEYDGVDAENARLVGLTRPQPIAHSVGAFVAAPEAASPPPPAPTAGPDTGASEGDEEGASEDEETASDAPAVAEEAAAEPADPCETVLDQSCQEILGPVGDPCAELFQQSCQEEVEDILGPFAGDPCRLVFGMTCDEKVDEILSEPIADPCTLVFDDTCVDVVRDTLEEAIDPCAVLFGMSCEEKVDELTSEPLPDACQLVTGTTCNQTINDLLSEPLQDPCITLYDKTCDEVVRDTLNQLVADPCKLAFGRVCSTDPDFERIERLVNSCPSIPECAVDVGDLEDPSLDPGSALTLKALWPGVVGGRWILSSAGSPHLASGYVPLNGLVRASAPYLTSTNNYSLVVVKPLGPTASLLSTASIGLPSGEGGGYHLGLPTVRVVPAFPSIAEARLASSCSPCESVPRVPLPEEPVDEEDGHVETIVPADVLVDPGQEDLLPDAGVSAPVPEPVVDLTPQACLATLTCGDPVRIPVQECDSNPTWWLGAEVDCIDSMEDIRGVVAFRGYSHRPAGAYSIFKVESSNKQEWQNGRRTEAGPFEFDGKTTKSKESGGTDVWPERGDCWNLSNNGQSFNRRPCSADGAKTTWGNDTWRWEKHYVSTCQFLVFCTVSSYERVYALRYVGGVRRGPDDSKKPSKAGYYERPRVIRTGSLGDWAPYPPGTARIRGVKEELSAENAASVTVRAPDGWGEVNFTSSVVNKTGLKVVNEVYIRNDLPHYRRAYWYAGDGHHDRDYWSCELKPFWTSSSGCANAGT
ncbi:MAG TPA: hypothetical protein VHJ76_03745, partial [Actinomycetota bacterium]|nr:hypothetical protein [Actinomycetota bacterium]